MVAYKLYVLDKGIVQHKVLASENVGMVNDLSLYCLMKVFVLFHFWLILFCLGGWNWQLSNCSCVVFKISLDGEFP